MSTGTGNNRTAFDGFREEFRMAWQTFPDKALFFVLLAAWVALFQWLGNSTFGYVASPSIFAWMNGAYDRPGSDDAHGYLIPVVVLVLFWRNRQALLAIPKAGWWPGLGLFAAALGLHVIGYLVQQPRVSIVAMFAGVYALLAAVWGWRFARACFFPFCLFVFCIPISTLAEPITIPLRQIATDIAVAVSHKALGIPVVQQGVQIIDPRGSYQYEVAAACSGIRSTIALLALTTIYGWVSFTSLWKRLLMMALAMPLALASNVLRLVAIIVAAEAFGRGAGEVVHNWFGFVSFALAIGAVLGVGHWLRDAPPTVGVLAPKTA